MSELLPSTDYIFVPVITDPFDVKDLAVEHLTINQPGWVPNEGNLDTLIIEAFATEASDVRTLASRVPDYIFRWYGDTLLGYPPQDATAAVVSSTWNAKTNLGYTIADGTQVGIIASGDVTIPFIVQGTYTIPLGSTSVTGVTLVAIEEGADGSGLGGAGVEAQLIDTLDWVDTIVLEGETIGGQDAESDDDYLSRLSAHLKLLSTRPILPQDFEILAQEVPGVHRALALDGYNPADSTSNNERMVAVALVNETGDPVDSVIKGQVDDLLESNREVNFIVNVIDPTYTTILVSFTAVCFAGYGAPAVQAAAIQAVTDYLSPAAWGVTQTPSGPNWVNTPVVRLYEVSQVINEVTGIDYITNLQLAKSGGTLAATDVALTGAAPLPRPGTITGVVNAPA